MSDPYTKPEQLDLLKPLLTLARDQDRADAAHIARLRPLTPKKQTLCDKGKVLLHIYSKLADPNTGLIEKDEKTYVTKSQLSIAIRELKSSSGIGLAAENGANFYKDFIRLLTRNLRWPNELHLLGVTARQAFGKTRIFQFIRYANGQVEPLPNEFPHDNISPEATVVSSDAITPVEKEFANKGGSFVAKVLRRCDIPGLHLRKSQPFDGAEILSFTHIDDNLKGTTEIDSFYVAEMVIKGRTVRVLVSVEIKRQEEVVLGNQVRSQIVRLSHAAKDTDADPGYRRAEYVIALAVAPREIAGKPALCVWSLKPVDVRDGARLSHDEAYLLDIEIAGQEAFRLDSFLDIY
jgi:hypothetical protein